MFKSKWNGSEWERKRERERERAQMRVTCGGIERGRVEGEKTEHKNTVPGQAFGFLYSALYSAVQFPLDFRNSS